MDIKKIAADLIFHANEWEDVQYIGVGFLNGHFGAQTLTVIEDDLTILISDKEEDESIEFTFTRKDFAKFMDALNIEEDY